MADSIEFWRSGEWTMVYLNGDLVRYGDHYHADEWLQERCGVVVVDDEDGHCVPDGHHPVHLLASAKENMRTANEVKAQADAKRAEAARLLAEAEELEGKR